MDPVKAEIVFYHAWGYIYLMRPYQVIIYGAYGYTGKLMTTECKGAGLNVLLSGRNASRLQALSETTDYPYEVCRLEDAASLRLLLKKGGIVIHCAGPFQTTAEQMVRACMEAGTHYLDITGEYSVFENLAAYDDQAKQRGILTWYGLMR